MKSYPFVNFVRNDYDGNLRYICKTSLHTLGYVTRNSSYEPVFGQDHLCVDVKWQEMTNIAAFMKKLA